MGNCTLSEQLQSTNIENILRKVLSYSSQIDSQIRCRISSSIPVDHDQWAECRRYDHDAERWYISLITSSFPHSKDWKRNMKSTTVFVLLMMPLYPLQSVPIGLSRLCSPPSPLLIYIQIYRRSFPSRQGHRSDWRSCLSSASPTGKQAMGNRAAWPRDCQASNWSWSFEEGKRSGKPVSSKAGWKRDFTTYAKDNGIDRVRFLSENLFISRCKGFGKRKRMSSNLRRPPLKNLSKLGKFSFILDRLCFISHT